MLSSRPELVTGGDVLVRTLLANSAAVTATLNGAAVNVTFTPATGSNTTAIALISGLTVGALLLAAGCFCLPVQWRQRGAGAAG